MASKVLSVENCGTDGFRWITLKRITWEDPSGRQRLWESAERTTRRGAIDGVAIIAKIMRKGQPTLLPVIKQFRPPVANYCLELPAGLVDGGESAGQAAVRELLEETGYTGRAVEESSICVSDPGMSNANMRYAVLEVDGDAPENQNVAQQLEDGEFIQVELVPWDGLLQHLTAEMQATGCEVDARLLSYALGMEHAKQAAGGAAAVSTEAGASQQKGAASAAGTRPASANGLAGATVADPLMPFGSPILSPQDSNGQPSGVSLGPADCGAAGPGKRQHGGQRHAGWPLFAAGAAAGAAACWLAQVAARSATRSR